MQTYIRFGTSSVIATLLDYAVTIVLTEALSVMYIFSSVVGLFSGGIANFAINKNWVFGMSAYRNPKQPILYTVFWVLNLLISTIGLYVLTTLAQLDYRISKVLTSVMVGTLLNYNGQKHYVFRV